MSELERGKSYEWIVTDVEDHTQKTGVMRSIQSKCMSQKFTMKERFWLDEKGRSPSLDDRTQCLTGKPNGVYPFVLGFRFFAKVLITMSPGRMGKRTYVFDPDSFTLSQTKEKPITSKDDEQATIRKEIEAMSLTIKTHQERLDWCDKRGAAYLKAYRQMDREGLV